MIQVPKLEPNVFSYPHAQMHSRFSMKIDNSLLIAADKHLGNKTICYIKGINSPFYPVGRFLSFPSLLPDLLYDFSSGT